MLRQLSVHKVWALIFAFVMIATLSVPTHESALAQDTSSLSEAMHAYMNEDLDKNISRYKFSDLKIKTDEAPNIYLVLYNEMEIQAERKVNQSLKAQGINSQAVGDLETGVNQQADYAESYEEELHFFRQLSAHQNEAIALEMYTNGTKRDAEFDLLDDLQKIENILFARREDGQLGPAISRSNGRAPGGVEFEPTATRTIIETETTDSDESEEETQEDSPVIHESGEICQLDDLLADELEIFAELVETESEDTDTDTDDSTDDTSTEESETDISTKSLGSFIKRDNECDAVFCFYTEEIRVTETAYFPDDNGCIACVLENLAESLTELNSDSVYPRKVSGNFLEPNMCKGALRNMKLDLSVRLVERPIFSSDPVDSVTELSARGFIRDLRNRRSSSQRQDEVDDAIAAQVALGATTDITELSGQNEEIAAQVRLEQEIQQGLYPVSSSLDAASVLTQDLHQRMSSMWIYFDSYNQMLASIQSSLNTISSKPVCE
jgi:hypothetical protein